MEATSAGTKLFCWKLRVFRPWVASRRGNARRQAQWPALEEDLEGSGEDRAPALQVRQLLRICNEPAQEQGDGTQRSGGGNRLRVQAGDGDRPLARVFCA